MSSSSIDRRLRRLEQHAEAETSQVFVIYACDDRDLHQHFGILAKPGRQLLTMEIHLVGRAEPNDENSEWVRVAAIDGKGKHITEPALDNFGPPRGPRRPGSEWVREF